MLNPAGINSVSDLKQYLLSTGASEELINQQIEKLQDTITLRIIKELLNQKPAPNKLHDDEACANYIKENFSTEEILKVTQTITEEITKSYLLAIQTD